MSNTYQSSPLLSNKFVFSQIEPFDGWILDNVMIVPVQNRIALCNSHFSSLASFFDYPNHPHTLKYYLSIIIYRFTSTQILRTQPACRLLVRISYEWPWIQFLMECLILSASLWAIPPLFTYPSPFLSSTLSTGWPINVHFQLRIFYPKVQESGSCSVPWG